MNPTMVTKNREAVIKPLTVFENPSGFIELCYKGPQNEKTVMDGVNAIAEYSSKRRQQKKATMILVDLMELTTTDIGSHKAAIMGMRTLRYKRAAFYGPLPTQVLLNTLSLVSGKQHKLRVFESRIEAVKWLKGG